MNGLVKLAVAVGAAACLCVFLLAQTVARRAEAPAPSAHLASVAPPAARDAPRSAGFGEVVIEQGAGGHHHAEVEINGRRIAMLVDTGATVVALTQDDARAIGLFPSPGDYAIPLSTANGVVRAAPAMLREARVGPIVARDVQAVVMPRGALGQSLLGMSFLRKLRGFEIVGGRLVLRS